MSTGCVQACMVSRSPPIRHPLRLCNLYLPFVPCTFQCKRTPELPRHTPSFQDLSVFAQMVLFLAPTFLTQKQYHTGSKTEGSGGRMIGVGSHVYHRGSLHIFFFNFLALDFSIYEMEVTMKHCKAVLRHR